ncbi:MAG TPA: spore germination protein [Clostridiaceae bacterium]|nr:spore germination protein [Clostridiaceae bacterium]
MTGICSFAIPDFSMGFTFRIYRFLYIILAFVAGFLGIAAGFFCHAIVLAGLKSFGSPYLAPYLPVTNLSTDASYFIPPMWRREKRADFLNTKEPRSQAKISMKWKFGKGKNL